MGRKEICQLNPFHPNGGSVLKLECFWNSPPLVLNISIDEVHIWRVRLDLPSVHIEEMEKILSFDEKLRAERFKFEPYRRRYIASHSALRKILSKYLYPEPDQLEFTYSPLGKPSLVSNGNLKHLCFSLSHSNEIALCAVTLNRAIGIDLEYIHPNIDTGSLARHFFSPRENDAIYSLPPDQIQDAFFDLWTLKEAYLKAIGEGIGGLAQSEFSMVSCVSPTRIINENTLIKDRWTILQMIPASGYTAGLAIEGNGAYIFSYYDF